MTAMLRDEALARIRLHRSELTRLGIARLFLFGSVARDEANIASDIDVVVDTADGRAPGLFLLARISDELERILGRRVDVISKSGLDHTTRLKRRVGPELVHVF